MFRNGRITWRAGDYEANPGIDGRLKEHFGLSPDDAEGLRMSSLDPSDPAVEFSHTYATDFEGNEDALSEGGVWSHMGLDWATVRKSDGFAYGTQTGNAGTNRATGRSQVHQG